MSNRSEGTFSLDTIPLMPRGRPSLITTKITTFTIIILISPRKIWAASLSHPSRLPLVQPEFPSYVLSGESSALRELVLIWRKAVSSQSRYRLHFLRRRLPHNYRQHLPESVYIMFVTVRHRNPKLPDRIGRLMNHLRYLWCLMLR